MVTGREVAGTFSLQRADKLSAPQSVAVLEENKVIVETLPTLYRYYVIPLVTGFVSISVLNAVALSIGSNPFWWNLAGAIGGVSVGMIAAFFLQKRKQGKMMGAIADGERNVSNDIVIKKGKVDIIELEEAGRDKTLHVVTQKYDFELSGDGDEIDRVYETLA